MIQLQIGVKSAEEAWGSRHVLRDGGKSRLKHERHPKSGAYCGSPIAQQQAPSACKLVVHAWLWGGGKLDYPLRSDTARGTGHRLTGRKLRQRSANRSSDKTPSA